MSEPTLIFGDKTSGFYFANNSQVVSVRGDLFGVKITMSDGMVYTALADSEITLAYSEKPSALSEFTSGPLGEAAS